MARIELSFAPWRFSVLLAIVAVLPHGGRPGVVVPTAANAAGRGMTTVAVTDVGPGGFTIEVVLGTLQSPASPHDVHCAERGLPPADGDASTAGGLAQYAWWFGMPDRRTATVEVVSVRETTMPGRTFCDDSDDTDVRTDRLISDETLGDAAPRNAGFAIPRHALGVPGWTTGAAAHQETVVAPHAVPVAGLGHLPDVPAIRIAPAVEAIGAGTIRDQAVGRLVVRPIALTADGSAVVRTRLRARVTFHDPASVVRAPNAHGPYAPIFSLLLNRTFLPRRDRESVPLSQGPPMTLIGTRGAGAPSLPARHLDRRRGDPLRNLELSLADPAADATALKIEIERDGPVAVTGAELAGAGWDLATIDPGSLSLSSGDRPWAFRLELGEDGSFDLADRIVFEGRAMTGPYTRTNVYWLTMAGRSSRIGDRDAAVRPAIVAQAFVARRRFEEDTRILWSMTAEPGEDRWMWGDGLTGPARVTHVLRVGAVAAGSGPARLNVALHGYTDDRAVDPDHHLRIWWNGRLAGEELVDGQGTHMLEAVLPPGAVVTGSNEFVLESVGDTGALVDTVFLNWVDLEYDAAFVAMDDRLRFAAPGAGTFTYTVDGFRTDDVVVWDVTDPSRPVGLSGVAAALAGDGRFRATFTDTAAADSAYVAFVPTASEPPARVVPNLPSDWHSPANGADYIVVAHPRFVPALEPLMRRRSAEGLRVTSVLIDDVYDEFSHGVFDPRAIRLFLQHAYELWRPPAPTYVLLVGEANLDYRRGYGAGPPNFVPSVQVERAVDAQRASYTSDLWFVMLHDSDVLPDMLPDMLIGRFSVSTREEAAVAVEKTLRAEDAPRGEPWQRSIVLVADDDAADAFEAGSERIAAVLPANGKAQRFYAGTYPRDRDISADIRAAIHDGAFALNFLGHGNVALWSSWPGGGRIFDNGDIRELHNREHMPVFTSGTCMNGWIDHPLMPVSMSEQWLTHPDGGGAVAWAASGLVPAGLGTALLEPAYRRMFDGSALSIGALTVAAGVEMLANDPTYAHAYAMHTLIGDPALVVSGVPGSSPTPFGPTAVPGSSPTTSEATVVPGSSPTPLPPTAVPGPSRASPTSDRPSTPRYPTDPAPSDAAVHLPSVGNRAP